MIIDEYTVNMFTSTPPPTPPWLFPRQGTPHIPPQGPVDDALITHVEVFVYTGHGHHGTGYYGPMLNKHSLAI